MTWECEKNASGRAARARPRGMHLPGKRPVCRHPGRQPARPPRSPPAYPPHPRHPLSLLACPPARPCRPGPLQGACPQQPGRGGRGRQPPGEPGWALVRARARGAPAAVSRMAAWAPTTRCQLGVKPHSERSSRIQHVPGSADVAHPQLLLSCIAPCEPGWVHLRMAALTPPPPPPAAACLCSRRTTPRCWTTSMACWWRWVAASGQLPPLLGSC